MYLLGFFFLIQQTERAGRKIIQLSKLGRPKPPSSSPTQQFFSVQLVYSLRIITQLRLQAVNLGIGEKRYLMLVEQSGV